MLQRIKFRPTYCGNKVRLSHVGYNAIPICHPISGSNQRFDVIKIRLALVRCYSKKATVKIDLAQTSVMRIQDVAF